MDPSKIIEINELDLDKCHGVKLLAYGPPGATGCTIDDSIKVSIDVDGKRQHVFLGPAGAAKLRDALDRWLAT
jgi:hypothetical protein